MIGQKNLNATLNARIILAKWHIYKCKLNGVAIFLYKFIIDLKYYIEIEKSIALKLEKLTQYNKTWLQIEEEIT